MLDVIALILVFSDGHLGGHTTAAYFHERTQCAQWGEKLAVEWIHKGHPATYQCSASKLSKEFADDVVPRGRLPQTAQRQEVQR